MIYWKEYINNVQRSFFFISGNLQITRVIIYIYNFSLNKLTPCFNQNVSRFIKHECGV